MICDRYKTKEAANSTDRCNEIVSSLSDTFDQQNQQSSQTNDRRLGCGLNNNGVGVMGTDPTCGSRDANVQRVCACKHGETGIN